MPSVNLCICCCAYEVPYLWVSGFPHFCIVVYKLWYYAFLLMNLTAECPFSFLLFLWICHHTQSFSSSSSRWVPHLQGLLQDSSSSVPMMWQCHRPTLHVIKTLYVLGTSSGCVKPPEFWLILIDKRGREKNPKNEAQVIIGGESEGLGRTLHLSKLFCVFVLTYPGPLQSCFSCKSMA